MPYFTAVLARSGGTWHARDVDVDSVDDLAEAADQLRIAALEDDEPVLLVLEREDDWFALVRVDGDEDPRVFISDAEQARTSPYAEVLGLDPDVEDETEGPTGDSDILADLGTDPEDLEALAGEDGPTTGDALAKVGEAAGFSDLIDSLR
jgi:putative tRNA adenosine deaminase-associated protein